MSQQASHTNGTGGGSAPSWFDSGASPSAAPPAAHTEQPPSAAAHPIDSALIGRTSIILVTLIGVILVCAWLLKRLGFQRDRATDRLQIVAARSLGQRERVVIVEIEDEWLVLGVTPQQINTLHRRPVPDDYVPATKTGAPTFGQALATNLSRLGQRDRK